MFRNKRKWAGIAAFIGWKTCSSGCAFGGANTRGGQALLAGLGHPAVVVGNVR
jgi:hypothetical protein